MHRELLKNIFSTYGDNIISVDPRFTRRRPLGDHEHEPSVQPPKYLYRTPGSYTQPDTAEPINSLLGVPLIAAASQIEAVTATYLRPTGVLVRHAGKMIEVRLGNRQATFRLGIDADLIALFFGTSGKIKIRLDFTPESFPNLILLQ